MTPPPVSERSSQSSSLQSAFESPVTTQTTSAQAKERLLRQFGDRLNSQAMLEVYKQICDYGEAVRREAWDQFHEKIALIRYDSGSLGDATVD